MVYSKKYGVGQVRFTHHASNVLCSSTKGDPTIRYLSLHDNAYLRYFTGHQSPICALEMSPLNDFFLSGAENDTVRVWDLRAPGCEGNMKCEGKPLIAVDPQGLVFAVALNNRHIRLFDMKNYQAVLVVVLSISQISYRDRLRRLRLRIRQQRERDLSGNKFASAQTVAIS